MCKNEERIYIRTFKKFEDACYDYDGVECWSARELQNILGYSQWRNFKNVIEKAEKSCEQAGEETKNHFAEFSKMVEIEAVLKNLLKILAQICLLFDCTKW
jgi:DNA-damage-inducible protein D